MNTLSKITLKTLLTRVIDSRDGYREAADEARLPYHKTMFAHLSSQRHDYALGLQTFLMQTGDYIALDGSGLASMHRLYINIKHKLLAGDDALFKEIMTGERALIKQYKETIIANKDSSMISEQLKKQLHMVMSNLDDFKFIKSDVVKPSQIQAA